MPVKILIYGKERKNNIKDNDEIIRNYIIIFSLINFLFIKIFCKIKRNIIEFFYFQYSSKITLKIKGIGNYTIFGGNINYLKEVYINRNKEESIKNYYYFNRTNNFVELILDDNINNCDFMFCGCSNITEINLSNFNTSLITSMKSMFKDCSSITSLDLSNFDTSQVSLMQEMFSGCSSLTSLNLSNFDTSQVSLMQEMFRNCQSLTSLNLSNFNTSKVLSMWGMFHNCTNLEYINLNNFDEAALVNNTTNYDNMFYGLPANIVICINENLTKSKIVPQIKSKKRYIMDCSDEWKSSQKNIIYYSNQCIENCFTSTQYLYEYNGKCYDNCTNGFLYDENNQMNKCKCELDKCLLCPTVALRNDLCTKCNNNYYAKENDPLNLGEYINCYKEPEGYYLDNN